MKILDARADSMTGEWAWGCMYLVAYQGWAWLFRARIDPWARRWVGGQLGVEVVWLPASQFPLEMWTWGLSGRGGRRLDSRVALCSTAVCFAAAVLPIALMCFLLRWTTCLSSHFGEALYLITPPLIAVFVGSHMRRARLEGEQNPK
jgi:hypothetical protein